MTECDEAEHNKFWCANCNVEGHMSWDQLCPKFIEECKRAERMDPERSYRFFPAQEPWTWELPFVECIKLVGSCLWVFVN